MRVVARTDPAATAMFDEDFRAGERAVSRVMRATATAAKVAWRGNVASAGLGQRLANAIRSDAYPKSTDSLDAAALVWSKAPIVTGSYETGAVIRSTHGRFLALPTPAAGRAAGGKTITPGEWQFRHGQKLQFINPRPGVYLLVAEDVRLNTGGQARRIRRKRRADGILTGAMTVPIFVLIPQVTVPKRLDLNGIAERIGDGLPAAIVSEWDHG